MQNRYSNFNDLTKIDIDTYVNNKLDPNTPWKTVQEIIKNKREKWSQKEKDKFNELLNTREFHNYLPIER